MICVRKRVIAASLQHLEVLDSSADVRIDFLTVPHWT